MDTRIFFPINNIELEDVYFEILSKKSREISIVSIGLF